MPLPNVSEGTIVVDLVLNDREEVDDARIVSGPMELRKPALLSLLKWHFAKSATEPRIEIRFEPPTDFSPPVSEPPLRLPQELPAVFSKTDVSLLPETLRDRVLKAITLREGQTVTAADLTGAAEAIRAVDEHLSCTVQPDGEGSVSIRVALPDDILPPPGAFVSMVTFSRRSSFGKRCRFTQPWRGTREFAEWYDSERLSAKMGMSRMCS
ncbi:MAG: hypothetical protein ACRD4P_07965 [Bryobacteraceae bacterium]